MTGQLREALERAGVRDPGGSRWKELPGTSAGELRGAAWICNCGGEEKRVGMVPVELGPAAMLVGQCGGCGTVGWARWQSLDREWRGG